MLITRLFVLNHLIKIYKDLYLPSQMGLTLEQFKALAAGALIMLVQGSLYVFGTLTYYIRSYLYYHGMEELIMLRLNKYLN